MGLIERTLQRAILDARVDVSRELSGDGWHSKIKAALCCPSHGECPLGCWAEADEEDD